MLVRVATSARTAPSVVPHMRRSVADRAHLVGESASAHGDGSAVDKDCFTAGKRAFAPESKLPWSDSAAARRKASEAARKEDDDLWWRFEL